MKNEQGFTYGVPALSSNQFHPSQKLFVTGNNGGFRTIWDPIDINFEFKNREIVTVFAADDEGKPTSKVLFYGHAKKAALAIGGRCTTDKF